MAVLYLVEQNTVLRKRAERLLVCRKPAGTRTHSATLEKDILLEVPCEDIDHVMIFGNIQITTQAMHQLLNHNIETALFSFHGQLIGQLTPPKQRNIHLRIAQFNKAQDEAFCLNIAKILVRSKLTAALQNVIDFRAHDRKTITLDEQQQLQSFLAKITMAKDNAQLLGIEGSGSACYFKLLGKMINPPFIFAKRTTQPPQDEVNAALSFGYVVLGAEIESLADGMGFDPYLGFYHSIRRGQPSLALDLVEEFRHAFVDKLVKQIFNKGYLTEQDFFRPAQGGVFFNTSGKKKFFQHYEKFMGRWQADDDPTTGERGIRSFIQERLQTLADALQHDKPFTAMNNLT